jgi:hypothetical protein
MPAGHTGILTFVNLVVSVMAQGQWNAVCWPDGNPVK